MGDGEKARVTGPAQVARPAGGRRRRRTLLLALLVVILALSAPPTPSKAASSGALQPPHFDVGIDTNGDSLFNFLRIDVSLSITGPGTFTMEIALKDDLDLAILTESSLIVSLAAGNQTVNVFLDGPDIYNGGVDGPYYAHITLLSEFRDILSTGLHKTSSYRYTEFQPYAAALVPPRSERTWDNDSDGLVNWIDLGFTLDVATAGTYALSSLLTDSTYTLSVRWSQTVRLSPGRSTLHQLFLGYPMRLTQKSGPYLVTNSLIDSRGVEIDFLFVETKAYSYSVFEGSPVLFAPPHRDWGFDTEGDGLYDILRVDVNLTVEMSGRYSVRGFLFGGNGILIGETATTTSLEMGSVATSLSFDGWRLFDSGMDGPYEVRLQLFDSSGVFLGEGTHTTAAYSYSQFEPRALYLAPSHEDFGVDLDGNGKFDVLRLLVHLEVIQPIRVHAKVALRPGVLASDIAQASASLDLAPGHRVVPLDFPGAALAAAGLDGPYWVVISMEDANGALLDQGKNRTAAYSSSDFDTVALEGTLGHLGDRGEDVDGNGLFNRLRAEFSVNVTIGGRYRLEGALLHDGLVIAAANSTRLLSPGPTQMDLVFGGKEISWSGRDGPYSLHIRLVTVNGAATVAVADFSTSAYPAAAFERAVPVSVTGRVSTTLDNRSLPGASVWAVDLVNFTSRRVFADSEGRVLLSAFEGTYWVVIDHPDANAKVLRTTFAGNSFLSVSLGPIPRTAVQEVLTWTGWDQLNVAVRYVFSVDGAALRLGLDWWEGNRDGWLDPSEWSGSPMPLDPMRGMIDRGNTTGGLSVNGQTYLAVEPPRFADLVSGDVTEARLPSLEISRSFRADRSIGTPSRLELLLTLAADTLSAERSMRLFIPGDYRLGSVSDAANLSVRARRNTLPVYVDPGMGSNLSEPASLLSVQLFFYFQSTYQAHLPSPPSGLVASAAGSEVTLTWTAPTTTVDGTRLTNLAGYRVYRSSSANGSFALVSGPLLLFPWYADSPGLGTFYYRVTAITTDGLEGPPTDPVPVSVKTSLLLVSVMDTSGAPVSGAFVRLEDSRGGVVASVLTDARGKLRLSARPGTYTLRVEAPGFASQSLLVVLSGIRVALNVTLLPDSPGIPPWPAGLFSILAAQILSAVGLLALLGRFVTRGSPRERAGCLARTRPSLAPLVRSHFREAECRPSMRFGMVPMGKDY